MANEWTDDEADYQAALESASCDDEDDEIRYGLTPLGALALDEGRAFSGFGPCAVAGAACAAPLVPRRGRSKVRGGRATPLLG